MNEHLLFLGRFLRHPRLIGAIAPSSPALASAMAAMCDLQGSVCVVELGPGTGALTAAIMAGVRPSARVLAIDREPAFVERLRARWPILEAICASAADLPAITAARGIGAVDAIISGLPFASLPAAVTADILAGIERTLRPGGAFTTFQYVHAFRMPSAAKFRRDISARMHSSPERRLVMRNLPPAYVLTWRRNSAATSAPFASSVSGGAG